MQLTSCVRICQALTVTACLFTANSANSQSALEGLESLSSTQLREDLKHITEVLQTAHPGLYAYVTPEEFTASVRAHEALIDHSMSVYEFSRIVTHLVATIRDGHSYVTLPDALEQRFMETNTRLPFTVRVLDRRLYIVCNQSDDLSIPDGSELLSINGMPANQILATICSYFMVDGYNEAGIFHSLGLEHYRPFGRVFPYIYRYPDQFQIEYREYVTSNVISAVVDAISPLEVGSRMWERYSGEVPGVPVDSKRHKLPPEIPLVTHRVVGHIGILRIARLVHGSYDEPDSVFASFYDQAFADFREHDVQRVIIDIRDNAGGTAANGALLLRHLVSAPFTPTKAIWGVIDSVEKYNGENSKYASAVSPDGEGRYLIQDKAWLRDLREFQPLGETPFTGDIYVLINGGTRSAAATLAGLLQQHTPAILIGDETSGNAGITNGVVLLSVSGEHSGVGVVFPALHAESDMPAGVRKRAVVPDLYFSPTIVDVLEGRDTLLEYALQLARGADDSKH